jgi:hypothetical protein
MSFSYKTLNSNDITLTSYIANKQWEVSNATLYQNGITIYVGENLPITQNYPFNPIDDGQTSNEEYRRLIFDSIKNLYYQNYISGSLTGRFFNSSSAFNYEQSTLTSGSMIAANRNLPTITGSYLDPNNPTVFDSNRYDRSASLYDDVRFDPDIGSKIVVLSIDQNIFGSGLSPNTFKISGSTYYITDDGEGNLYDALAVSSSYVGNIFYSQGLVVLTHQDYLCLFGVPPTTKNDYFTYQNIDYLSQSLSILSNDFADCNAIDPDSVNLISVPGYTFPDHSLNLGTLIVTPNQTSVIPGNYKLEYVVENYTGIISNTSSISLTVTSLPLEINNLIIPPTCFSSTTNIPVTFSINYGVPPYSYSLDQGTTYTGVPGFFNKTVSGSMTASLNNTIYVKDYLGTTISQSFNSLNPAVTYATSILKLPCSAVSTDGIIQLTGITAVSASINGGSYIKLPFTASLLGTGSYSINYKDTSGCITGSTLTLGVYPPLTASVTQSNVSCYGGTNGSLTINLSNVIDNFTRVNLIGPTGNYIYNDVALSTFPNNSITTSSLSTGSYTCSIVPDPLKPLECQNYSNIFTITSPTALSLSVTASYISSCSNAIIISGSGGTPPYSYYAINMASNASYSSDLNPIALINLDKLNPGTYTTFLVDSHSCSSPTSSIEIFGRTYNYTGSVCETSAGQNTGYVSSSGIEQVFNSGIYSGLPVTSSYSNGTTLFGPTLNFKQLFVSGTIDSIYPCSYTNAPAYSRYYQNTTQCPPPTFCIAPSLSLAIPTNCYDDTIDPNSDAKYRYTVSFDSASNSALSMSIQYSLSRDFSGIIGYNKFALPNSTGSRSIRTWGGSVPPTADNQPFPSIYDYNDQPVYFRAFNSCSNGVTSSYSNTVSAFCSDPTPQFGPLEIQFKNSSGQAVEYVFNDVRYSIANNRTSSFSYDGNIEPIVDIPFFIIGRDRFNGLYDENNNPVYLMSVSGSDLLNSNVSTLVIPQVDSFNYPATLINNDYNPSSSVRFASDGAANNIITDVVVNIDRSSYTSPTVVKLFISPQPIIFEPPPEI